MTNKSAWVGCVQLTTIAFDTKSIVDRAIPTICDQFCNFVRCQVDCLELPNPIQIKSFNDLTLVCRGCGGGVSSPIGGSPPKPPNSGFSNESSVIDKVNTSLTCHPCIPTGRTLEPMLGLKVARSLRGDNVADEIAPEVNIKTTSNLRRASRAARLGVLTTIDAIQPGDISSQPMPPPAMMG